MCVWATLSSGIRLERWARGPTKAPFAPAPPPGCGAHGVRRNVGLVNAAIPAWQLARPPEEALAWAADAIGAGAKIERLERLTGGGWLASHALDVRDRDGVLHPLVLRRWARPGWEEDPTFTAGNEAAVLNRLERLEPSIPAPRVIAVTGGHGTGRVPAILLTRLDGRPRPHDVRPPNAAIDRLAELLVRIHAVDDSISEVAPPFQPYYELDRLRAPANARRPDLWARAIEAVQTEPASQRTTFIHRDYHPGNALWSGGRLTGIVDWTGASWGPPASDMAHLRANLGVDHEPAVAERAETAYLAAGGQAPDQRWWDLRTLLDWLPDQGDLAGDDGLARLERYLAWLLESR